MFHVQARYKEDVITEACYVCQDYLINVPGDQPGTEKKVCASCGTDQATDPKRIKKSAPQPEDEPKTETKPAAEMRPHAKAKR